MHHVYCWFLAPESYPWATSKRWKEKYTDFGGMLAIQNSLFLRCLGPFHNNPIFRKDRGTHSNGTFTRASRPVLGNLPAYLVNTHVMTWYIVDLWTMQGVRDSDPCIVRNRCLSFDFPKLNYSWRRASVASKNSIFNLQLGNQLLETWKYYFQSMVSWNIDVETWDMKGLFYL